MLEDDRLDHNSSMVEVEGKIDEESVSILIDTGSTHSYITLTCGDVRFEEIKA